MSLSHLSLPSISHVLEVDHGFIPRNPSTIRLDQPDVSMTMTAALALGPVSSQISPASNSSQSHLMTTINCSDNALEDEEEKQFSFVVGFLDEPALDETHGGNQVQGSSGWIKCNLSLFVDAVRKLLPIKIAEAFLCKAVQH